MLPTEGEGRDVSIARVNFPATSLNSKIDGEGKPIKKIKSPADGLFCKLFVPSITFKLIADFRAEAAILLESRMRPT